jgi:complex iron-sulfur molybdoenzyme family reductase subunit gamma
MDADAGYVAELQWGEDGREIGDAQHGQELMGQLCVGCHHFADKAMAMPEMAPNLNNIGLQASASYIRDSITEPSAVVVRSPNPNRHYNKAGGRDSRGGYPINPMYLWYTVGEDGELVSKMPKYEHLTDADVADIVAYLKSVGAQSAAATGSKTASNPVSNPASGQE